MQYQNLDGWTISQPCRNSIIDNVESIVAQLQQHLLSCDLFIIHLKRASEGKISIIIRQSRWSQEQLYWHSSYVSRHLLFSVVVACIHDLVNIILEKCPSSSTKNAANVVDLGLI